MKTITAPDFLADLGPRIGGAMAPSADFPGPRIGGAMAPSADFPGPRIGGAMVDSLASGAETLAAQGSAMPLAVLALALAASWALATLATRF